MKIQDSLIVDELKRDSSLGITHLVGLIHQSINGVVADAQYRIGTGGFSMKRASR